MITRVLDYLDFAARAYRAEARVKRLQHLPRALEMSNDRAERWKQRHDALRAQLDEMEKDK